MAYPSEFYYIEKGDEPFFNTDQIGGTLSVEKIIQQDPKQWQHPQGSVEIAKTLIFADWTSLAWSKSRTLEVQNVLEKLLSDGFTIYVWQKNKDFIPLTKENINILNSISVQQNITFENTAILQKEVFHKLSLSKEKIHIIDDYWIDESQNKTGKLLKRQLKTSLLSQLLNKSSGIFGQNTIYFDKTRILRLLAENYPASQTIITHDSFSSAENETLQILRMYLPNLEVNYQYRFLNLEENQLETLIEKQSIELNNVTINFNQLTESPIDEIKIRTTHSLSAKHLELLLTLTHQVKSVSITAGKITGNISRNLHLTQLKSFRINSKSSKSFFSYEPKSINALDIEKIIANSVNIEEIVIWYSKVEGNLVLPAKLSKLTSLSLSHVTIDAENLENAFRSATSLIKLYFFNVKINGDIKYPLKLNILIDLIISDCNIKGSNFEKLLANTEKLEYLKIDTTTIDGKITLPIKLNMLKSLFISSCTTIKAHNLEKLIQAPNGSFTLSLYNTRIDGTLTASIGKITELSIVGLNITANNIEKLISPITKKIEFSNSKISDQIKNSLDLSGLKHIKFTQEVTWNNLEKILKSCHQLERLEFFNCEIKGQPTQSIHLPKLNNLIFYSSKVTANQLHNLLTYSNANLHQLSIKETQIYGEIKSLPLLGVLSILEIESPDSIWQNIMVILSQSPNLHQLNITNSSSLTNFLEEIAERSSMLEVLKLDTCILSKKFKPLNFKFLKSLYCYRNQITLENLAALISTARRLEDLVLSYPLPIGSTSERFALPSLKKLVISDVFWKYNAQHIVNTLHSVTNLLENMNTSIAALEEFELSLSPYFQDITSPQKAPSLIKGSVLDKIFLKAPNIKKLHIDLWAVEDTVTPWTIPQVETLQISYTTITPDSFYQFTKNAKKLTELKFHHCQFVHEVTLPPSLHKFVLYDVYLFFNVLEKTLHTAPQLKNLHVEKILSSHLDLNNLLLTFPQIEISGDISSDEGKPSSQPVPRYSFSLPNLNELINELAKLDPQSFADQVLEALSSIESQLETGELSTPPSPAPAPQSDVEDFIKQLSTLDYANLKNIIDVLKKPSITNVKLLGKAYQLFKKFAALHPDAQKNLAEPLEHLATAFTQANKVEDHSQAEAELELMEKEIERQHKIANYGRLFETWKKARPDIYRWEAKNLSIENRINAYFEYILGGGEKGKQRKRLIEFSSTDDLNAFGLALQTYCQDKHRPLLYVQSPNELTCQTPYIHEVGNIGETRRGPGGPTYNFLTMHKDKANPPVFVVDFVGWEEDDFSKWNRLFDTSPSIDNQSLPEGAVVIALTNLNHPNAYVEADVYSRFGKDGVDTCPFSSDELTLPPVLPLRAPDDTTPYYDIELYHDENWLKLLLGDWKLKKDHLERQTGQLSEAFQAAKKPTHICINNGLWDSTRFCYFWQQATTLGHIKNRDIRSITWVRNEGYDWATLKQYATFTPHLIPQASPLNPGQLSQFFTRYVCENYQLDTVSGFLTELKENQTLSINLTRALSDDQWAKLLTTCKKQQLRLDVYVAPGVRLPQVFDVPPTPAVIPSPWQRSNAPIAVTYSDDVSTTTALLTEKKEWKIIDVSECSPGDLLDRITGELTPNLRFHFESQEGILNKALGKQNILLRGTFSNEIADALAPILLGKAPDSGQVRVVCANKNVFDYVPDISQHLVTEAEQRYALIHIFKFTPTELQTIPKIEGESLDHWRARLIDYRIYRNADPERPWRGLKTLTRGSKLTRFNPKKSAEEITAQTQAFLEKRKNEINAVLNHAQFTVITGLSGVGKSTFMIDHFADTNTTVYFGLDNKERWETDPKPAGHRKVLVIDEANIGSRQWSEFENPYTGYVVFLCNPISYSSNRKIPTLFEHHGNAVVFDILPMDVVYELTLKPTLVPSRLATQALDIAKKILDVYYFLCECSQDHLLISPREVQMMALFTLSYCEEHQDSNPVAVAAYYAYRLGKDLVPADQQSFFEKEFAPTFIPEAVQSQSDDFLVTASRQPSYQHIRDLLALRNYRRTHKNSLNATQLRGGLGGMGLIGRPGVGKTKLLEFALEELPSHDICRIPASFGPQETLDALEVAFNKGQVVKIDEFKSSSLEKVLNDYTMGLSPNKKPPVEPGFILFTTRNPSNMPGRKEESTAFKRRFTLKELFEYIKPELMDIFTVAYGIDDPELELVIEAFLKKQKEAIDNNYKPEPTFRDLERDIDKLVDKGLLNQVKKPKHKLEASVQNENPQEKQMKDLFKELIATCSTYETHLKARLKTLNRTKNPSAHKKIVLEDKLKEVERLKNILIDNHLFETPEAQIAEFSREFKKNKSQFKADSDPFCIRFLKNTARILAAIFSLTYTYHSRKKEFNTKSLNTHNFWKQFWKSEEAWEGKTFVRNVKPKLR